jgi:hypothetical protein
MAGKYMLLLCSVLGIRCRTIGAAMLLEYTVINWCRALKWWSVGWSVAWPSKRRSATGRPTLMDQPH